MSSNESKFKHKEVILTAGSNFAILLW